MLLRLVDFELYLTSCDGLGKSIEFDWQGCYTFAFDDHLTSKRWLKLLLSFTSVTPIVDSNDDDPDGRKTVVRVVLFFALMPFCLFALMLQLRNFHSLTFFFLAAVFFIHSRILLDDQSINQTQGQNPEDNVGQVTIKPWFHSPQIVLLT